MDGGLELLELVEDDGKHQLDRGQNEHRKDAGWQGQAAEEGDGGGGEDGRGGDGGRMGGPGQGDEQEAHHGEAEQCEGGKVTGKPGGITSPFKFF